MSGHHSGAGGPGREETLLLQVSGKVQGVGFRPFVYRLAVREGIRGWVCNTNGRVEILARGSTGALQRFRKALVEEAPDIARPRLEPVEPVDADIPPGFRIRRSRSAGKADIHLPVDYHLCDDCLGELLDPGDRRYRYPFINCTQCGPRYTIIRELPYDRLATSMAGFTLCRQCEAEYRDPLSRRFHAEPIACPRCGPQLAFDDFRGDPALEAAVEALCRGRILAVKGIGGYHLLCDAADEKAVERLRRNKPRPHKPLAVLFPAPADDPLFFVRRAAVPTAGEKRLLLSPARPIVLCRKAGNSGLAEQIAPGLHEIGVMLPYSPLHYLLLEAFGGALVATSGNISGEPVITEGEMAENRLAGVADAFLHHDRPIVRPADDSLYRTIGGRPRLLRHGRGVAPLELALPFELPHPVMALGGQMKNTVALGWGRRMVISPHIGDMGTLRSETVFAQLVGDLQQLYKVKVKAFLCDAHPGYFTHRWAAARGLTVTQVLHHYAHASSLFLEGASDEAQLVFTWDGVGYGKKGVLWGGEAFVGAPGRWRHYASFRPFRLPGGEKAGREPWRSAAALCWELGLPFERNGSGLLHHAWQRGLNSPATTAVGRLFDAAASLLGVCDSASFEGQGPMWLEALAEGGDARGVVLPMARDAEGILRLDWSPLLELLLDEEPDRRERAAAFHATLARAIAQVATQARDELGIGKAGLSGGVFQNRLLTEQATRELEALGLEHLSPPEGITVNDGSLSAGQILEYGYGHATP